ncbi:unnamed protein product [Gadus morhua 'NCC']
MGAQRVSPIAQWNHYHLTLPPYVPPAQSPPDPCEVLPCPLQTLSRPAQGTLSVNHSPAEWPCLGLGDRSRKRGAPLALLNKGGPWEYRHRKCCQHKICAR